MTDPPGGGRAGLTRAEIDELLSRPLLARLATIRPDGYPAIVPVWIEWDGEAAWIVARAAAAFVADIRRDPRVCLSVVADDDPDRRAQLFGRAVIDREVGPLEGAALDMARRMADRYEGEAGVAYIERSRSWPRVVVCVRVERIVSWGSSEWHPRYVGEPVGPGETPAARTTS